MKLPLRAWILALLGLSLTSSPYAQSDYYYVPRQAAPGEKTTPGSGVLVREVEIRKGDTLSGISRKYSGRGSYYPQILLFNGIRNPHRIHDGERVRVPVSRNTPPQSRSSSPAAQVQAARTSAPPAAAQPVSEIPLSELKKTPPKRNSPKFHDRKHRSAPFRNSSAERKQFARALKSYQRGEWRAALNQFDAFLNDTPDSPLAADANLYKADCYLKLGAP